jgi:drug/metabolite transporter (DMT)-like permease
MWFPLSLLALLMLTARRSAEKKATSSINSMALAWLQQAVAMPFIIATLFFAKFYWPGELSAHFWELIVIYVALSSLDLYLYFRALTIADISYVAPLLSLVAVGNIAGAYIVLGQIPSLLGLVGAALIMGGAYLNSMAKKREKTNVKGNRLALLLILIHVVLIAYYANLEVSILRLSNPTSYNFYTSILSIPLVILVSSIIVRQRRANYENYWANVKVGAKQHVWPLVFIGVTYTINLLATYQAKLDSPNAGYVGAVKSASVLPIVIIGLFFFKEKVVRLQWLGLVLIIAGLALIATN